MAVANSAFIVSLNYTSVAHVLVLQSIAPLVAAGLGVVVLGERLTGRTACAMAIALGGVIVMVGAPDGGPVLGDGLALLTGVAFALVIVIARRYRGVSMAPAMALAQLLVVIVFAPFAQFSHVSLADVGWLALLGCGQIGLGAIFFISAARFIPSSEMAMIFLLEVVLGPLWTWIALSETPNIATLAGGAAVIVGVGAQVGGFGKRGDRPMAGEAEQPQGLGGQRERPPGAVRNLAAVRLGRRGLAHAPQAATHPMASGSLADFIVITSGRRPGGRAPGSARCGGRRPDGPGTRIRRRRPGPRLRSRTTAGASRRRRSRRHLPRPR
jgi:threonine/homoserine efflux transporter RhtA